jgi:phage terminase large subunit-like protein
MFIGITTAGMDRQSICFEKHDYTRKILEGWKDGSFVDDTWFGIIFTLDEEDDWRDESVWIKANPNLGASKYIEDLRMKAQRAEKMPTAQNNFLRREMNMWVQGEAKWMDMDAWRKCGGLIPALKLPEHLKDRTCYAGLDLSSTNDLTALALVFPDDDGYFDVVLRFWLPEDVITTRTQEGTHYDVWARDGYITKTDGNVIDYDWIFEALREDLVNHRIERLAYDRWGASRVVQVLENMGIQVVQFGQGVVSMNPPMQELMRLTLSGKIRHGDNPVLTWMMDNVVSKMDAAGNIKPDKEKSKDKIDGAVALIMALDLALRADPAADMSAIMSADWGM